eukprot:gene24518-32977_t
MYRSSSTGCISNGSPCTFPSDCCDPGAICNNRQCVQPAAPSCLNPTGYGAAPGSNSVPTSLPIARLASSTPSSPTVKMIVSPSSAYSIKCSVSSTCCDPGAVCIQTDSESFMTCVPMQPPLCANPVGYPAATAISAPSTKPSAGPSATPSVVPSTIPAAKPSKGPTRSSTGSPSAMPSSTSKAPSAQSSTLPLNVRTRLPSSALSSIPSQQPSIEPSNRVTATPSLSPMSNIPTLAPAKKAAVIMSSPTMMPSVIKSMNPSVPPTVHPSVKVPT